MVGFFVCSCMSSREGETGGWDRSLKLTGKKKHNTCAGGQRCVRDDRAVLQLSLLSLWYLWISFFLFLSRREGCSFSWSASLLNLLDIFRFCGQARRTSMLVKNPTNEKFEFFKTVRRKKCKRKSFSLKFYISRERFTHTQMQALSRTHSHFLGDKSWNFSFQGALDFVTFSLVHFFCSWSKPITTAAHFERARPEWNSSEVVSLWAFSLFPTKCNHHHKGTQCV